MAKFSTESRNMDFGSYGEGVTEGISKSGVEAYVEYLQVEVIQSLINKLDDVGEIQAAIDKGWQGESRDKFLRAFASTINQTEEEIQAEFKNLVDRLSELIQSYYKQDENMMEF